jgi:tetratricopeptide (TPR) repeat protein
MGKHKKQQRLSRLGHQSTGLATGEGRARVEALLANGKTRDAVEAAKQLLKQAPDPDAEALVVRAYQARMQALQASGMHKETQALGALVSERFPAYKAQIVPLLRQAEISAGNFQALLTELSTADTQHRRELETILTRGLTDPAIIADSPALPSNHPLKRMACVVRDLFTAVTSGPLPENALVPLNEIPRHSPVAPWKLLIRALDAFYRCADAAALANLAGIPPDSAPGRLVPIIRRLIGEQGPLEDRSFAVKTLLDKVGGNRGQIQSYLSQLAQTLAAYDERKALSTVQALVSLFQSVPTALWRTFLATILRHWHRHGLQPHGLLRALPGSKKDPDILRLIALTLERAGWDTALEWWDGYLTTATASGVLPKSGPEIARVLLHMAALFPANPEEVLDVLGVEDEKALRTLIRTGELPSCFDRRALLERARTADPDPQVFRALVEHYTQWGDAKRTEAEAEAWRHAHPQDLDPLLYLIRVAERRNAYRKALDLLAVAEALNHVHPDVRQSRFRLLLASAERRLKEGKFALALEDLERLAQEPRADEGDHKAYLFALCWAAAHKTGDTAGVARLEQTLITTLENPVLRDLILQAVAGSLKLNYLSRSEPSSPGQAIDGLVRACELFRTLDRPFVVPSALLTQVEKNLEGASPAQLHSLGAGGLRMGWPTLTYAASGQGLAQGGPLVYRFLLARGQVLCTCGRPHEQERARQCLRAARELASRARDREAVREASTALDALPDWEAFDALMSGELAPPDETPLTQEEIAHVIDCERGMRKVPHFLLTRAPRKPRKPKSPRRRLPRGLLDELFSFLEGRL